MILLTKSVSWVVSQTNKWHSTSTFAFFLAACEGELFSSLLLHFLFFPEQPGSSGGESSISGSYSVSSESSVSSLETKASWKQLQIPSSQCFGYTLLGSVDCFARTNKLQLHFAILFIMLFSPFGRKSKASSFASFLGWRFSFSTSDFLLLCSRKLSFLLLGCHVSTCKIYCARPLYRKFTTPSNALTNLDPGGYRGVNFHNLAFYGHLRQR